MSTDPQPQRRSPKTIEVYREGVASYFTFCEAHGYAAEPADVHVVMSWMDWMRTQTGKRDRPIAPGTIRAYLAGLRLRQRQMRDTDPTWPTLDSSALTEHYRQYQQWWSSRYEAPPVARFTARHLLAMLQWFDHDRLRDRRDAAVLSLIYGATARANEVAALTVEAIEGSAKGLVVHFDQWEATVEANPVAGAPCPVRAILDYVQDLAAHGIDRGRLLGQMAARDRFPDAWVPLTPEAVGWIVTSSCRRAGLGHYTAESLRAGSAKDIAEMTDGDLLAVVDAGRWVNADAARRHIDRRATYASVLGELYRQAAADPVTVAGLSGSLSDSCRCQRRPWSVRW